MALDDSTKFFPLDKDGGYPSAIDLHYCAEFGDGEPPRTMLELELCKIAGAIRDRRSWWVKMFDENIVAKWREEACGTENVDKFNYALSECKWQAQNYKGPARPAAADGVFARDDMPTSLSQRILNGIEEIRKHEPRDEHPGSDGIVIDIVHPSMYAYEQGVTPVMGDATVVEMPPWKSFVMNKTAQPEEKPDLASATRLSSKFGLQWLPAEFWVSRKDGTEEMTCKINSYINSLHPEIHSEMYPIIADAFVHCVPLLEQVLTELKHEKPLRVSDKYEWRVVNDDNFDDDDDDEDDYPSNEYWARHELNLPKVPTEFKPPQILQKESLAGRPLQVIVKIASIELTPEKPKYSGGSWHVEGMRNERIVATACMYVESENCTESRLEFRAACREPDYLQNDDPGVLAMYGLRNEEPLVQSRGVSRTLQGRVLAWPNTLQHRVSPFELEDKTRNGRRTILCFFLVDPTLRVRSTATVPPQCREWQEMAMVELMPELVPAEVSAKVVEKMDGMSYKDACERRVRLMSERKEEKEREDGDGKFFERPFSLCEH